MSPKYSDRLNRQKGRRSSGGSFSALPHEYFQSPQFARLSARAVKALIDIYCQYRGSNNGDLTATWVVMHRCGWRSKSQLAKALQELETSGWLLRTRQGSINHASLYAVTFCGIDPCARKLDPGIQPDSRPLHLWKIRTYESTRPQSGRRVRKLRATALGTGQQTPHGGSNVAPIRPRLSRDRGQ